MSGPVQADADRCRRTAAPGCCLPSGHRGLCRYKCAEPACPGLTYPASDFPHPANCGAPKLEQLPDELVHDVGRMTPLLIHPEENLADVKRALAINGYEIYSVPSRGAGQPYLCIAQRWRIALAQKRRARAALTPEQRATEDATDKAVHESLARGFE